MVRTTLPLPKSYFSTPLTSIINRFYKKYQQMTGKYYKCRHPYYHFKELWLRTSDLRKCLSLSLVLLFFNVFSFISIIFFSFSIFTLFYFHPLSSYIYLKSSGSQPFLFFGTLAVIKKHNNNSEASLHAVQLQILATSKGSAALRLRITVTQG